MENWKTAYAYHMDELATERKNFLYLLDIEDSFLIRGGTNQVLGSHPTEDFH